MGYPLLAPIYPVTSIFWEWRPEIHHTYLTHPTSFDIFISNDRGSWVDIIGIPFPLLRKAMFDFEPWASDCWFWLSMSQNSTATGGDFGRHNAQISVIPIHLIFPSGNMACSKTWGSYLPRSVYPREKDKFRRYVHRIYLWWRVTTYRCSQNFFTCILCWYWWDTTDIS